MEISPAVLSAAFVLGLMAGSFLNVCIWRIPAEEQVARGRSHCRGCRKPIAWYDNIPLVSFAVLGGRCRHCRAQISWQYPAVELATGLLFAGLVARFGLTGQTAAYAVLGAALIVLAVIDLREMFLPDEITLPGISAGVVMSYFLPELHGAASRWGGLWASASGVLGGAGVVWLIRAVGTFLLKKEAMGLGDVKLMAMVGGFLGFWKTLGVILFLGPVLGSCVGLALIARKGYKAVRLTPMPYGPMLVLGTFVALFWGDAMIGWYLRCFGI